MPWVTMSPSLSLPCRTRVRLAFFPLTVTVILLPSATPGSAPTAWLSSSPLAADSSRTTLGNSGDAAWTATFVALPPASTVPGTVVTVAT
uniref:Uncharacterized protein n=1 Tax=Zea mays TaxID=4577 RepID=C4J7Y0_MAIZE|nr:unknown [Zea mays]